MQLKAECEYETLRNAKCNANGAYAQFVFVIDGKKREREKKTQTKSQRQINLST